MNRYWLPPDISTHGGGIDQLIDFMHYFMVVLFVVWGMFFVYCLFRFRQRAGHSANYQPVKGTLSKCGEVLVIVVEVVLLVGFSMPVWARTKDREEFPKKEDALEVHVVAEQFAWNVHYPGPDGKFGPRDLKLLDKVENPLGLDRKHPEAKDDITTINLMHAPVNKPVIVRVSTKDVIHSFWIPMLRVKQDTIPGMSIPIWFEATKTSAEVREMMARTVDVPADDDEQFVKRLSKQVALQDYFGKDQAVILAKEASIDAAALPALRQAGVSELRVGPREPMEIQCAQLCGLQHYSMRGFFTVDTAEQFDKWMQDQAQYLPAEDDWGDEEEEEE